MNAESKQYHCPTCNAPITFDASQQKFACSYCGNSFKKETIEVIYDGKGKSDVSQPDQNVSDKVSDAQRQVFEQNSREYNCPSCGASVVTNGETAALSCMYCHSPVILSGKLTGDYRPSAVIPFKYVDNDAKKKFAEYTGKRWFIPNGFKKALREESKGVYIPYWVHDCNLSGGIVGIGKNMRSWRSGDYRYTEVKEYTVSRYGTLSCNGVPADASKNADDQLMENLEPYNYSEQKPFDMSYLSGFAAEKYTVEKSEVYPRVKKRAVETATATIRDDIKGYNSFSVTRNTIDVKSYKVSQYLMPVWFTSYTHSGKKYQFAMNGQTGKFAGSLPVSKWKVFRFIAILSLVVLLLLSALFVYEIWDSTLKHAITGETYDITFANPLRPTNEYIKPNAVVIDYHDYFDDSYSEYTDKEGEKTEKIGDFDMVAQLVQKTADEKHLNVMFLITSTVGGYYGSSSDDWSTEKFAVVAYEHFFDSKSNGVVMAVNMQTRYVYTELYGNAQEIYYNSLIDSVYDDLKLAASDQTPYSAVVFDYCKYVKQSYTGSQDASKYLAASIMSAVTAMLSIWFIAVVIITLITALAVSRSYKMKKAPGADVYLDKQTISITSRSDTFLSEHTTQTKIESSSSSGGGGGGGGHSSGGHSGGGRHF
ncbi:MAG: hypothetical protein LBN40_01495 [Oscillospiraceae bacterium]|jgi:uncharacterized membrane protein YgcG/DNA-directed RNA polymerase subunit RPC12/RpoP|nr:hypothetical protein [Oscillospiraceae bacterium]